MWCRVCKVLLEAVTSDGTQKWTMLKNPARMVESCPDGDKDGNPLKGILRILALFFWVTYILRMVLFFPQALKAAKELFRIRIWFLYCFLRLAAWLPF